MCHCSEDDDDVDSSKCIDVIATVPAVATADDDDADCTWRHG